ncbi:Uma2 family endonuclease [Persephonella sp. KM09-Lau-8]|uniref:Uma2 family endonuclease n=1 Tax=Persephonella sp. KM09-Lau-8 TaxID=1158345 RepID=UPI00068CD979|nr:Uma2 family endonuclease [Persephonella sp. KM09-Lau-8]
MPIATLSRKSISSKQKSPKPYKFTINHLKKMYEAGIFKPEEKIELINGETYKMTPIGFRHMKTVDKLNKILNSLISQENLPYVVSIQNPIKIDSKNLLYPDIAIYPEEIYKKEDIPKIKDAVLIIEISDTTLDYDREVKLPVYAKGKAREVWIINLKDNILEKYTQPSKKLFKSIHIYQKKEKIKIFNEKIELSEILNS